MSDTNGTTPALESASLNADDLNVVHYYWVKDPLGLNLCRTASAGSRPKNPRLVQAVGGLMAVTKTQDCPDCVRIYEQRLRCQWNASQARNDAAERYSRLVGLHVAGLLMARATGPDGRPASVSQALARAAEATGISTTKLRNRCEGRTPFALNEIAAIAQHLGLAAADLLPSR